MKLNKINDSYSGVREKLDVILPGGFKRALRSLYDIGEDIDSEDRGDLWYLFEQSIVEKIEDRFKGSSFGKYIIDFDTDIDVLRVGKKNSFIFQYLICMDALALCKDTSGLFQFLSEFKVVPKRGNKLTDLLKRDNLRLRKEFPQVYNQFDIFKVSRLSNIEFSIDVKSSGDIPKIWANIEYTAEMDRVGDVTIGEDSVRAITSVLTEV